METINDIVFLTFANSRKKKKHFALYVIFLFSFTRTPVQSRVQMKVETKNCKNSGKVGILEKSREKTEFLIEIT